MAAWLPQVADKQQLTEVGDRFRANLFGKLGKAFLSFP